MIDYKRIRPDIMASIRRYVDEGLLPGGFLTAVICNDLRDAIGRADEDNHATLRDIVAYFYNECPGPCWGSPEKMDAWLSAKYDERQAAEAQP